MRACRALSEDEVRDAPIGHLPLAGSNVEVVAYRINAADLCLLVNKHGACVYRATLVGVLDPELKPHMSPLIDETFVIRDLAAMRMLLEEFDGVSG